VTIEGPRVLAKRLQGVTCETNDSTGTIINRTGDGWLALTDFCAVQRSYFDLSGYNRDSLTTFFQGVDMQYAGPPYTNEPLVMQILEFITTEYLSDAELISTLAPASAVSGKFSGPGYSPSTLNMDQIVFARRRTYNTTTTSSDGDLAPLNSLDVWGTCAAATSDKLHITRVLVGGTISKTFNVPDVNVVITAIIAQEKELPFLMRQKRSYELATGP